MQQCKPPAWAQGNAPLMHDTLCSEFKLWSCSNMAAAPDHARCICCLLPHKVSPPVASSADAALLCRQGNYGAEADLWSAGVILYILLCGLPPFYGRTEKAIFAAVRRGCPEYESSAWQTVSSEAKDLVQRCACSCSVVTLEMLGCKVMPSSSEHDSQNAFEGDCRGGVCHEVFGPGTSSAVLIAPGRCIDDLASKTTLSTNLEWLGRGLVCRADYRGVHPFTERCLVVHSANSIRGQGPAAAPHMGRNEVSDPGGQARQAFS